MTPRSTPTQGETPQERYERLKAEGNGHRSDFAARQASARNQHAPSIDASSVIFDDVVPAKGYWHGRLKRGDGLRLVAATSTGVAASFWRSDETSERFNPGDTIKVQWTSEITTGRVLLSDMGRAMVSITHDDFGRSDCLAGVSQPGPADGPDWQSGRAHFLRAALKNGLTKRDVGPCISFFAPVAVAAGGKLTWQDQPCSGPFTVDLRAEMDLIVALSNSAHPMSPDRDPLPLTVTQFRAPPAAEDDLARTGTVEARRAFENTDALFGDRKRLS
ncbi:urea amidolyase associated protein UAAP1 [Antarctobacter sp.]|uniref:urea amidolyase associated protein UAAP1 n=1 Tax=Antarctobacter sp. TaxID=1872577 RepID=UPI002B275035|nr:urea amidolyase associated protein UAAP1 [Antarctobacter sp.]